MSHIKILGNPIKMKILLKNDTNYYLIFLCFTQIYSVTNLLNKNDFNFVLVGFWPINCNLLRNETHKIFEKKLIALKKG